MLCNSATERLEAKTDAPDAQHVVHTNWRYLNSVVDLGIKLTAEEQRVIAFRKQELFAALDEQLLNTPLAQQSLLEFLSDSQHLGRRFSGIPKKDKKSDDAERNAWLASKRAAAQEIIDLIRETAPLFEFNARTFGKRPDQRAAALQKIVKSCGEHRVKLFTIRQVTAELLSTAEEYRCANRDKVFARSPEQEESAEMRRHEAAERVRRAFGSSPRDALSALDSISALRTEANRLCAVLVDANLLTIRGCVSRKVRQVNKRREISNDDSLNIFQDCSLKAFDAMERFDPNRNFSVTNYIKKGLKHYLSYRPVDADASRVWVDRAATKIDRFEQRYYAKNGKLPDEQTIVKHLHTRPSHIRRTNLASAIIAASTEMIDLDGQTLPILDALCDPEAEDPATGPEQHELWERLWGALGRVDEESHSTIPACGTKVLTEYYIHGRTYSDIAADPEFEVPWRTMKQRGARAVAVLRRIASETLAPWRDKIAKDVDGDEPRKKTRRSA